VVKVTGSSNKRVSLAALIAVKPGCRARLIYRVHHSSRKDRRKGFTETGYARLLDAAHQQLGGPLVLVWDNLNSHVSGAMTELIAARDWLTVYQLPAVCTRAQPRRTALVAPEKIPGQLGQTQPRPAHDPAHAHAAPARPPRRLPRQHRPGPHTLPVTTIRDL